MMKISNRIRASAAVLVIMSTMIYAAENTVINENFSANMLTVPLWIMTAIIATRSLPQGRNHGKLQHRRKIYIWAMNMATAYVIINIIAGYLLGFGKSPYQFTLRGILLNLYVFSAVVGREFVRDYILRSVTEHKKLIFAAVILFMTLISVSLFSWTEIKDFKTAVIFLSEVLLPQLGENILATTLVYFGVV